LQPSAPNASQTVQTVLPLAVPCALPARTGSAAGPGQPAAVEEAVAAVLSTIAPCSSKDSLRSASPMCQARCLRWRRCWKGAEGSSACLHSSWRRGPPEIARRHSASCQRWCYCLRQAAWQQVCRIRLQGRCGTSQPAAATASRSALPLCRGHCLRWQRCWRAEAGSIGAQEHRGRQRTAST
jgi:hypothetical protein